MLSYFEKSFTWTPPLSKDKKFGIDVNVSLQCSKSFAHVIVQDDYHLVVFQDMFGLKLPDRVLGLESSECDKFLRDHFCHSLEVHVSIREDYSDGDILAAVEDMEEMTSDDPQWLGGKYSR